MEERCGRTKKQKAERVGMERIMSNGESARIIAYRGCEDIDIEFEDGTIRKSIQFVHFLKGNISKIKTLTNKECKKRRVGEIALANNGQQMTIIDYRNVADIDIQFEDGTIVYNKRYPEFSNGEIENPNCMFNKKVSINEFAILWYLTNIGFEKFQQGTLKEYGLGRLELDCFNPVLKVAIEYDGYRWHNGSNASERDIKKNELCKNNSISLIRVRDYRLPNINDSKNYMLKDTSCFSQELNDVIIDIYNYIKQKYSITFDLDINLQRDRLAILHDFGLEYRSSRVGEESVNSAGFKMKIIEYRTCADIDVQFEDGAIKKGIRYGRFLKGDIRHPSQTAEGKKKARLNEERIMHCGLLAKIIEYRTATDIDIKFETDEIVKHKTYNCFKKGCIAPQNHN